MVQLVTRIDDEAVRHVDDLVAAGVASSRSDAVRKGLELLIDLHRRRQIADAIVAGYRRQPQTAEEVAWAEAAALRMIAEEPW